MVGAAASQMGSFDQFIHEEPTPEFLAVMDEQQQAMFRALPDESQRNVARLRFEGFSNEEIAKQLEISVRSVERKLKVIREIWTSLIDES